MGTTVRNQSRRGERDARALPAPGRCLALVGALLAALATGCGSSVAPMPRRMVADPITLPEGMDSLSGAVAQEGVSLQQERLYSFGIPKLGWAHGITDRWTLTNLTWLSYALREEIDRGTGEGRAPFALAVSGGVLGVGFSSVESIIATPGAGVTAIARQGRFRVAGSQTIATLISYLRFVPFSVTHVDGMLQIVDGVALGLRASASYVPPLDDSSSLRTSLGLRGVARPWHWLSLHVESMAVRTARWTDAPGDPPSPDGPLVPEPRNVHWDYPIWLGAAFHW